MGVDTFKGLVGFDSECLDAVVGIVSVWRDWRLGLVILLCIAIEGSGIRIHWRAS